MANKPKQKPKSPKTRPTKAIPGGPPVGAPTKLTPDLIAQMRNLLIQGNYVDTAYRCCKISRESFTNWMKEGGAKDASGIYKQFFDMVHESVALAEARDLNRLDKLATDGDFRAIAFRMERRFSSKWGRREQLTIEPSDVQTLRVEERRVQVASVFDNPELAKAAALLAAAMIPKRLPENVVDGEIVEDDAKGKQP